jgi:hypothetical protein
MARIKIEDLPIAENLTPEQEELIQGAGLRSFRPKLEGLEDRQLMASGLAGSLPVPPPALGQAQVGLRDFLSTPPGAGPQVGQVHTLASSQLGAAYGNDADKILPQARDIMYKQVLGRNAIENRWALSVRARDGETVDQVGNTIKITFDLNDQQGPCKAVLKFEGSIHGATSTFSLKEAKLEGYHGAGLVGGMFDAVCKEIYGKNTIQAERFDATWFKNNSIKIAEQLTGKSGFQVKGFVGIENGTQLSLDTGRGELRLTWKYDYTQAGASYLKLSDVSDPTNQLGAGVKQAFMDAKWWTSAQNPDAARQQGANQFGQSVVNWFQEKGSLDKDFINLGNIKASYKVQFTAEGANVIVELERGAVYDPDKGIDVKLKLTLTFHLKYEGMATDGSHTFSLMKDGLDVKDNSTWTKNGHTEYRKAVDLSAFGTSSGALRDAFNTYRFNVAG